MKKEDVDKIIEYLKTAKIYYDESADYKDVLAGCNDEIHKEIEDLIEKLQKEVN